MLTVCGRQTAKRAHLRGSVFSSVNICKLFPNEKHTQKLNVVTPAWNANTQEAEAARALEV